MSEETTPTEKPSQPYTTLRWEGDESGALWMIDQTKLPLEHVEIECKSAEDVWEAIRSLRVRGAPAIGVAAGYGVVLGLKTCLKSNRPEFDTTLEKVTTYLAESRPTAVNLFWALDRMKSIANQFSESSPKELLKVLLKEAQSIEIEDREMCAAIGRHGAERIAEGDSILTHCNAGALATAGDGTALSMIFAAHAQGKAIHVFADETRPLLQGARLTTWELQQRGIPVTLICDSAAGSLMQQGKIRKVITGADRIAANGDAANKIGTYSVAQLARVHKIPFYIAAPTSTFDGNLNLGGDIPIEERLEEEITQGFSVRTAPIGVKAYNPAFDVTPAELINAIVTDQGIVEPVNVKRIREVLSR